MNFNIKDKNFLIKLNKIKKLKVGTRVVLSVDGKFDCLSERSQKLKLTINNLSDLRKPDGEQDVANYGLRKKCITEDLWQKYPVNANLLSFAECGIKYYNQEKFNYATIDMDFKDFKSRVGDFCTCGKTCAVPLNGIDDELLKNYQCYSQCIICKAFCIRKVLNHQVFPDPNFCNEFFNFYEKFYKDKFRQAIRKYFFLTPNATFLGIKTYEKQIEVLPCYLANGYEPLDYQVSNRYKQHDKEEDQRLKEKVRQITDPDKFAKWFTLILEKPLTSLMYAVFGHEYAVGFSNAQKAKTIEEMLNKNNVVTLDCTAFDNSHNEYIKQPWTDLVNMIVEEKGGEISQYINTDVLIDQLCKNKSLVDYYVRVKGKEYKYCTLDLGQRLASGSVYTTLLNTFLMNLLVKFTAYKLGDLQNNDNSISGDDAATSFSKDILPSDIKFNYYQVFEMSGENFLMNSGVKLKYDIFSDDPTDTVPCSLDIFKCPKCGFKAVRTLSKYIINSFVSISYNNKFLSRDLPIEYFEQIIYIGESSWFKGLELAEKIFAPLNHNIPIRVIADKVLSIVFNKNKQKLVFYTNEFIKKVQVLKNSKTEKELIDSLQGLVFDKKCVVDRQMHYCDQCSKAYDDFVCKKYGLVPEWLFGKRLPLIRCINGVVVDKNYTQYIPAETVNNALEFYQRHRDQLNNPPNQSMIKRIYMGVVKSKMKYVQDSPNKLRFLESYNRRSKYQGTLEDLLVKQLIDFNSIFKKESKTALHPPGFVEICLKNKLIHILLMHYQVEGDLDRLSLYFEKYDMDFDVFYKNEENTFKHFTIEFNYPPNKTLYKVEFSLYKPLVFMKKNQKSRSSRSNFLREYMIQKNLFTKKKHFERVFFNQLIRQGIFSNWNNLITSEKPLVKQIDLKTLYSYSDQMIKEFDFKLRPLIDKGEFLEPSGSRLITQSMLRLSQELKFFNQQTNFLDERLTLYNNHVQRLGF